jgi:DNA repair protein RadA/Sms
VEIQALVSRTHFGAPRRLATGVDPQRLALLSAVLEKRLDVNLWDQDIYLNVVGGLEVDEPAADLAIAAAILSSLLNKPVLGSTVVFGEVGLGGEIRPALFTELRLKEALMLGFTRAVTPVLSAPLELRREGVEIVAVRNLQEAQSALFGG